MAKLVDVGTIGCHFESLTDPRHTRNRKHLSATSSSSPCVASSAAAMGPPPFIAGPAIVPIG